MPDDGNTDERVHIESWEMELLRNVVRRFRTPDRDELEAELARKLVLLKTTRPASIRNWRAYLAKFFFNKASNWIRDERARDLRFTDLRDETDDDDGAVVFMRAIGEFDPAPELISAVGMVWDQMDPALRRFWVVLLEEDGNQARVARRLNKHRNTVRAWVRTVQEFLTAHGLQPVLLARRPLNRDPCPVPIVHPASPVTKPKSFVTMSTQLLQTFLMSRFSGTQWRILLWVFRETTQGKQRTIPCDWSRIAQELSLDRTSVIRAGRSLIRIRVLFLDGSRMGIRRDVHAAEEYQIEQ